MTKDLTRQHFNPLSLYRERHSRRRRSCRGLHFNPLSLYRERHDRLVTKRVTKLFQSTLPIQGETKSVRTLYQCIRISIHSPYTGRDTSFPSRSHINQLFQSTLPIQGETCGFFTTCESIRHFNPLSLYRERPWNVNTFLRFMQISIHSPYTGRDTRLTDGRYYDEISIHSPYTGRDKEDAISIMPNVNFNPLSLYRERP